ncbi:NCS2 family permease [Streptosporangium roseum]|uniref:Xanthine/uracil/vitamin C permease n=1 Tax=Streptosporangium roseum (strain ATCC 12428 / DSM 43021 / JCM 3005 / KCTC 9067 / NCIMB 10171 / NRRL 2505 / NI 9100) TaxID=479432 RepID=D2B361_STRRD|nr:NCS2 family permease [Streptosporangium roseum]ACZ85541.1 xanthine/uracil/vitamin C permease [Streptosporangium roseum DSM 43021]
MDRFDRFFELSARGSTVGQEVRGGLTTFMAMAYIILLNPIILGGAVDVTGAKLSIPQLTASTIIAAAVSTILMGLVGNAPFGVAAGLGLNAVVAYQAAPFMTWAQAMGLVVLEGLVIVVLAVSGVRRLIMNSIPLALKHAISVGIGMFITLIGLVDAGFVARGTGTPVQLGRTGHLTGWPVALFCFGLLLVIVLFVRKVRGAILIGIVVTAVLAIVVNSVARIDPANWGVVVPRMPEAVVALPDAGLIGQVDLFGGFARAGAVTATVVLFTLVLSGFFDAMGTIIGVSDEAGMVDDEGRVPRLGAILTVDGVAGAIGGFSSASANTVFVESAAGVGEGARTGLAALVTGGMFVVTLFFTPLATVVPAAAAAPALVLVGALMMTQARNVPWEDLTLAIPAFLTIVMMPFTYSITNGVGAGVISYTAIQAATGRARRIPWLLWVVTLVFAAYFAIEGIRGLLG